MVLRKGFRRSSQQFGRSFRPRCCSHQHLLVEPRGIDSCCLCLLYLVSCFFFSQFDQVFAGKQNKWSLSSSALAVIISIRMTYGFDN